MEDFVVQLTNNVDAESVWHAVIPIAYVVGVGVITAFTLFVLGNFVLSLFRISDEKRRKATDERKYWGDRY